MDLGQFLYTIKKIEIQVFYFYTVLNRTAVIANNIIPKMKRLDALHLAIASVNELDMIMSFNFKHINKLKTKTLIPAVNRMAGYRDIIIAQPEEVIDYEIDD
jgi:hypothetical protein